MATPVDFPKYLQSLIKSYESQPDLYTLTDLQVEVRVEISPEDRSPQTPKNQPKTKIVRLEVLAGIRKYLDKGNVLLAGKPGSGKSTVLQRFRWELAREALKDGGPIPILVQLRSDRSIVQAICAEFRQAKLRVSPEDVDDLLLDGKLLLLLDGVNEMPSPQRRDEFQLFRDDNSDTRMIFTTRDLALGGSLGIEKQLEMCALTKPQMEEFVHKHLPQHGDSLLRQLRDRLREIAETPLLLWMMCEVFEPTLKIPQSKGELFDQFHYKYEKFKGNIPVSEDSRRFKSELLQQLAFVMLQGDLQQPTEGFVAISRDRAEGILERWLHHRGVLDAPTKAKEWLEDLLEHHLLQVAAKPEEIEFHHQLFQEYYAGRALLKLLVEKHDDVTDDERLQHFYLNYFKWTEPLAFMLSLLADEDRAVRVVRLALDVDVMLGARLAGEVKREFQKRAVGLVDGLDVPGWLKVALLGEVRSDAAIPGLLKLLEHSDWKVRSHVAYALGKIGSEIAITGLLKLVKDSDHDVRKNAVSALEKIDTEAAIYGLLKFAKDSDSDVRSKAADGLGKISSKAAIPELLKLIKDSDFDVQRSAADALSEIGSDEAISGLLKLVTNSDSDVAWIAADVLGEIGSEAATIGLLKLLKHSDTNVRSSVAYALGEIGSDDAILGLVQLVQDSDPDVRWMVADALCEIGSEETIPGLIKLLQDLDPNVREMAADALGKIGYEAEAAIPDLIKLLEDSEPDVCWTAADALGEISSEEAIPGLLKLVKHSDPDVRLNVIYALEKIGSEESIPGLLQLVEDSDTDVRLMAGDALENICYESAIFKLIELAEDSSSYLPLSVVDILGKIGSDPTIPGLFELLEDPDSDVRASAADAIANIAKQHAEKVVPHLPHLLTLILPKSGKEVHRLILAIQAACKYYNYSIRQLSLTPEIGKHPANASASIYNIQSVEKLMSNEPPIFNQQNATIGVNYAAENSNPKIIQKVEAAQESSPEAALNAVVQIIQALEKKYTYVQDEQQARHIIDAEFKEIKEQKPIEWQNLISLKRLYNGGKNAAVKVGEHFAESNPWGKGIVAFIEGVSEDVN
ncbi:MAG: NACHT domain-containing protein [Oscillatoriales cyanobacterium]|nr:MAG: NACHT domain-containing protein [Oscillatoriales cyanobacterium]TAG59630.1 MAG: NACHT domain-containing protein [Oscillatoriales cyanobacterium]